MAATSAATATAVRDISSKEELDEALRGEKPVSVHFWASWCDASKHMDEVFAHLATDFPHAVFLRVEAENQPEISEAFGVSAVPFFAFCKDGKTVDTLEGADPSSLANKVAKMAGPTSLVNSAMPASLGLAAAPVVIEKVQEMSQKTGSRLVHDTAEAATLDAAMRARLEQLVNSHPVFLFMKGSPESPKCKFSRRVVEILDADGVPFGSFDILTDPDVRESMKIFSNWPTFPQLFVSGELLGGCDIVTAMHDSGELTDVLKGHNVILKPSSGPDSAADMTSRLRALVNSSTVMVFMKGTPDEPKCGFSRKLVEILRLEGASFSSFDVLSDEEVRQGLKTFSDWPSYPQLYVAGELIGGSDVALEMHKSGELAALLSEKGAISPPGESLDDRIRRLVQSEQVMLFMKGSPEAPKCGFSSKVVEALRSEQVNFGWFDVLSDEDVRQGIKRFADWPTFPQLFYKGELIGGCDVVLELQRNGELKSAVTD